MSKVVFDISMTLDGFVTASNRRPEEPMGDGGLRLVDWAVGDDEEGRAFLERSVSGLGASICGRNTYDTSLPWWGADGPSGEARRPLFVVTHKAPEESPEGGVYTFVTDGIGSALDQAKAASGGQVVTVMGGASIGQQYIAARLVDEISIHLVPVLFGGGTRMFEHLGTEHIELEPIEAIETRAATHLRYRIVK